MCTFALRGCVPAQHRAAAHDLRLERKAAVLQIWTVMTLDKANKLLHVFTRKISGMVGNKNMLIIFIVSIAKMKKFQHSVQI